MSLWANKSGLANLTGWVILLLLLFAIVFVFFALIVFDGWFLASPEFLNQLFQDHCDDAKGVCETAASVSSSKEEATRFYLPIVTILVSFFLGFVGLKRLQLYDEMRGNRTERRAEMDALRAHMRDDLAATQESLNRAMLRFQDDMKSNLSTSTTETKKVAKEAATDIAKDVSEQELAESEEKLKKVKAELSALQRQAEKLNWMKDDPVAKEALFGEIGSIGEFHKVATKLADRDEITALKELFHKYFPEGKPSSLIGAADDFFNSAMQYAQQDLEPFAVRICEEGLRYFPNNVDLLSSAIKFAGDAGKAEDGRQFLDRLNEVEPGLWNWRCWAYIGDFLKSHGSAAEYIAHNDRYLLRHKENGTDQKNNAALQSMDEKAVSSYAQWLFKLGRENEAKDVSERILSNVKRAPQTALLAAQVEMSRGEYQKVLLNADRALLEDARDQSAVNNSACYFIKANAYEMLFVESLATDRQQALAYAGSALLNYDSSLRVGDTIPSYYSQAPSRTEVIVNKLRENLFSSEEIYAVTPNGLRAVVARIIGEPDADMAPGGNEEGPASAREILVSCKQISEDEEDLWDEGLAPLVRKIKAHPGQDQLLELLNQAITHFMDDPSEIRYVKCLRRLRALCQQ